MFELWTKNVKTKKTYQLSGTFRTKKLGMKLIKRLEENKTNWVVGKGRGFRTKQEAISWTKRALKHPPLGLTKGQYKKALKLRHKPATTKLFLKKKKVK